MPGLGAPLRFQQALRQLLGFREGPAIFAGDTNLREAEVKQEKLAKEVSRSVLFLVIEKVTGQIGAFSMHGRLLGAKGF